VGNKEKRLLSFLLHIMVILILLGCGNVLAQEKSIEIMPLTEVKKGMVGIGKTVIEGTKIEDFDVEIIDVFRGNDIGGSYILVKVGGGVIERTGGIAAGMSGSPVYVDGKLIGAISHRYPESDHSIGLITPAEDMLNLLRYREKLTTKSIDSDFVPIQSPIFVSGMGKRAFNMLREEFNHQGISVISIPSTEGPAISEDVKIEPGSAIGVQLVRGSVDVTSLGTVTYVDDSSLIAFGHPFLHAGNVNFFASSVYIHSTIKSDVMPFKLGTPLKPIGTVIQDRNAGIIAVLDNGPASVSVRLTVLDEDNSKEKNFYFQIVRDPVLFPRLLTTSLLQGLDSTLDRLGQGTASVSFYVRTRDGAGSFSRENVFYSGVDVAAISLYEVVEYVTALVNNDISDVEVIDIGVKTSIKAERCTAQVIGARINKEKSAPKKGQLLLDVDIKPYRGKTLTIPVKLQVSEGISVSDGVISVYGGPFFYRSRYYMEGSEEGDFLWQEYKAPETLNALVKGFTGASKNNEIVVEFRSFPKAEEEALPVTSPELTPKEDEDKNLEPDKILKPSPIEMKEPRTLEPTKSPTRTDVKADENGVVRIVVPTDYVLSGWASIDLMTEFEDELACNPPEGEAYTKE
jgi:hypothetical protein